MHVNQACNRAALSEVSRQGQQRAAMFSALKTFLLSGISVDFAFSSP